MCGFFWGVHFYRSLENCNFLSSFKGEDLLGLSYAMVLNFPLDLVFSCSVTDSYMLKRVSLNNAETEAYDHLTQTTNTY